MNKNLLKYGISIIVCSLVAFYYCLSKEILLADKAEMFRILADAFTLPGLLMLCVGLLVAISTTGILDGVAYGVMMGIKMLIPGAWTKEQEKYPDYVERKRGHRATGYGFLIVVGGAFLLIAIIFVLIFNQYYVPAI